MSVSIIVPVLNEAPLLRPFLSHLRQRAVGAEIVVADGGSSDGTSDHAQGFCDQLVVSEASRAIQMNAGARAARGDILWFVHVDAKVPWSCLEEIERIMGRAIIIRFTDRMWGARFCLASSFSLPVTSFGPSLSRRLCKM